MSEGPNHTLHHAWSLRSTNHMIKLFISTTKKLRPIVIDNYETLLYVYIQIYKYINKYIYC